MSDKPYVSSEQKDSGLEPNDPCAELNRLRWASRRGMLELDLILEPFINNYYEKLDERYKGLYAKLLEEQDQDLFNWFIKKQRPESDDLQAIVACILSKTGMAEFR